MFPEPGRERASVFSVLRDMVMYFRRSGGEGLRLLKWHRRTHHWRGLIINVDWSIEFLPDFSENTLPTFSLTDLGGEVGPFVRSRKEPLEPFMFLLSLKHR